MQSVTCWRLVAGLGLLLAQGVDQAWAQQEERADIAIMPFDKRKLDAELPDTLTDSFQIQFARSSGRSVIGKTDIVAMLGLEKEKELAGCDEGSCLAEIGGALGVRYIVTGRFAAVGRSYVITVKLIDVKRANVVVSDQENVSSDDEQALLDAVQKLSERFGAEARKKMTAGNGTGSQAEKSTASTATAKSPSTEPTEQTVEPKEVRSQDSRPPREEEATGKTGGGPGFQRFLWIPGVIASVAFGGCCIANWSMGLGNIIPGLVVTAYSGDYAGCVLCGTAGCVGCHLGLGTLSGIIGLVGIPASAVTWWKGRQAGAPAEPNLDEEEVPRPRRVPSKGDEEEDVPVTPVRSAPKPDRVQPEEEEEPAAPVKSEPARSAREDAPTKPAKAAPPPVYTPSDFPPPEKKREAAPASLWDLDNDAPPPEEPAKPAPKGKKKKGEKSKEKGKGHAF